MAWLRLVRICRFCRDGHRLSFSAANRLHRRNAPRLLNNYCCPTGSLAGTCNYGNGEKGCCDSTIRLYNSWRTHECNSTA